MDRRRAINGLALAAPVAVAGFLACSSLKDAPAATDGGVLEDGHSANVIDSSPPPIPVADAGPPPADTACGAHDEWTTSPKATAGCEPRQVIVVEDIGVINVNGVSIAHTPAGRVAISYNSELPTGGAWHVAQLTPSAPGATPSVQTRSTSDFEHDGYLSRVIGTAPDTISALTFDVDDASETGALHVQRLASSGPLPATGDLVLDGVKSPSEIAYAIDPAGAEYVTARFGVADNSAKLVAYSRKLGGADPFAALPILFPALTPQYAPGVGAASLFVDPNSQLHVLFHENAAAGNSTPRYEFLAVDSWSVPKTVEDGSGLFGFDPHLAIAGNRKYALYFDRPAGGAGTTADLRLATWEGEGDVPQIQIVDSGISSNDPMHPLYRAAMAIDKYGLLHIAEIAPLDDSEKTGQLRYLHQHPAANGSGTDWLTDIVDPNVIDPAAEAEVDLVVDENARPHIAYVSGVDSKVRYATRYDR